MALEISPSQKNILDFYRLFMSKHGRAPSIREAAKALEREVSNVHYHLKRLEKEGLIVRTGGHRGVQLVDKSTKMVPLLGTVACGEPIAILEEVEDNVQIPESMLLHGHAHFALRAKGDSMIKAGIRDGDTLIIRKQSDVADGDIAVVATGDPPFETATLKRVYHSKKAILLKPENDELDPYLIMKGDVRGKLVGVIRNFENKTV